ncbi:putative RWP-RK domain-containing protein [Hibiscus syriacus]|uniref:RWP-RK domain-containing protein n=1 Tax=Hibiscus syriacus TaxID=106335 RepID=A0A6A2YJ93_HIBSY|nr:putative RWP-RK domain-containing protein [Hibiscus syriacus]
MCMIPFQWNAKMRSPTTPKLSLYSFPSKGKEPLGMITPPIHVSVSIPFQWEEAPGKPRRPYRSSDNETDTSSRSKPNAARCLELPPRLLAESKIANMPSPTTFLDGPDECWFVSNSLSFRKSGSLRSLDNKRVNKEIPKSGSTRWGSFKKSGRVVQGSFSSSTPVADGGDTEASIYESFKQVVPWRRRNEKMK